MKFLFDDESFSFETLRAAGFACYRGAELGEVVATAGRITDGDEASWQREWSATADRVRTIGENCLAKGRTVSAREAFLRASNYYRTAEFYLRDDPAHDPRARELYHLSRDTFAQAMNLLDTPVRPVAIPYQDTTLPGYLYLVDDSGAPRPTVLFNSGFDSTLEESYVALAAGALDRGYNVLAFDGPGQGAVIREQGLPFRPDWEAVITPVVDYAVRLPEVDEDRIALYGYSLGGLLVARAAAFEHRIAALILNDGLFDYHGTNVRAMPEFVARWIEDGRDEEALAVAGLLTSFNTTVRWALRNGVWTFGASSSADYIRKTKPYTLAGIAQQIACPTLVLDAENDIFFRGEAARVYEALTCPKELVVGTEAEGAGEHCHMGAMLLTHQRVFDWLDENFSIPS
ncbi:alpha/beta hydrolase family protein [Actinocrispum wychmicini]|uniref:Alpha-beta hydrolase superfamily lysophospholipase n=1 Tax=Actinocrispum wychmicini TaxID=1213861 RepID=A0A4R2J7S9_9PSEU|nr:alpha/beta fold hydrolase [Actinocrispum wychmicini]TCO55223.1 alpha-beta hydrolase superfamily lysophospholipase [Actinocrispum wychmicini]